MAYLSDAHDGRLYCYYRTRAVVLNTGKNELFSCEAAGYDNTTSGFSTTAPVLGEPLTPLREWVARPFDGVKLIAHCEKDMPRRFIGQLISPGSRVTVLIGPEGDFSPEEIGLARQYGFADISLGRSRLRTETAAVAVAFVNESYPKN